MLATRPKRISVRQTAPRSRELAVIEDGAASFTKPEDLPVCYNAYSPSGTAAGDVVYVNYARPEDFAELTKRGISLKGKIRTILLPGKLCRKLLQYAQKQKTAWLACGFSVLQQALRGANHFCARIQATSFLASASFT